jgi:o-succinylbenzoate synthase
LIRATRLVEHAWTLSATVGSAAGTWSERRALLLVLEDEAGHVGLGEAAPLPGFGTDTLAAARASLAALLGRTLPEAPPADRPRMLGEISAALTSPSARSALEGALLDVWARRRGVPAYALLAAVTPGTRAPLSAWLPDERGDALAAARSHLAHGGTGVKVKLDAARGLGAGLETLEALRRELGPGVALRADANRSATVATLVPFLDRVRALGLEWLEEPTAEPISADLGVPLALDESLQAAGAKPDLAARPFVAGLVLKPTALGGLARCLELAAHARAHGRAAVASHALEGPVGFMTAVTLAFALGSDRAHGLTAHRALRTARPPGLAGEADVLEAWTEPGLGLELATALAGTEIVREEHA